MRKLLLASVFLAACSTSPQARIKKNQAAFDSWPATVQEKVKAGRIDIGFTEEQVQMALGRPDRKDRETSSKGSVDVWAWTESRPGLGVSMGIGTGGGGYGGGVSVGTGTGGRQIDKFRVEFQDGKVVSYSARER